VIDSRTNEAMLDVVASLLTHQGPGESLRVLELSERLATLVARSGKVIRVFRAPDDLSSLEDLVEQIVAHNPRSGSELVILGGAEAETEAIRRAVPGLLMHPFVVFQHAQDGSVRSFPQGKGEKSPRYGALRAVRTLSEQEAREVISAIEEQARSLHDDQKERASFFRGMNTRRPIATYGLLGAIGCMFLLQSFFAPQSGDALEQNVFMLSMGALFPPLVEEGQWYRLVSAGFLHGGLMHVGVNSFVLYLLGGQTERVLGSVRFLLLYTVALLAGSFASLQFLGNGMSVGASGAVWGLLGAQVALAYGRPPVLPKSVAESIKPLAKQNILLNVGISFLPGIDAAAHFGGGLAGAALLASGLLYRKSGRSIVAEGVPRALPYLAAVCVAGLAWGVAMAITEGKPWSASEQAEELRQQLR
jgi:rhomboid protease GluP